MILDAGVLISIDREEAEAGTLVAALRRRLEPIVTTEPIVAQVWRDGGRQARLAHVLKGVAIHPFEDGRPVGRLLQRSGTSDVVDAHLVHLAVRLAQPVLTGDPDDLRRIAASFGAHAPVIHAWP